MKSDIYFADKNFTLEETDKSNSFYLHALIYKNRNTYSLVKTPLSGRYQMKNLATVAQATDILRQIGYKISNTAFAIGIESVVIDTGLRGRWEIMSQKPTIVCETAHNEDGIRCLIEKINSLHINKLHIIYGCVNDKDYSKILEMLPKNANYYFCKPSVPRGLDTDELYNTASDIGLEGNKYESLSLAMREAKRRMDDDDILIITGSIFLVADAINLFDKRAV
jgi:dihydrofolate synthase/folylpolyglutamate synthase